MSGKLIIVSAPSGAGKTTIVNRVLKDIPELSFSVSATSRPKRKGEIHARHYYFLSEEDFKKAIENGELLEWEEVYPGQFYGTLRKEVQRLWNEGKTVVFDLDVLGGMNLKNMFGNRALAIFIMPPSIEELRHRLEKRSTEQPEKIEIRMARAGKEIKMAGKFDCVIVNDDLDKAVAETEDAIRNFITKE